MNNAPINQHHFIIEALDQERLCPVLQTRFEVTNLSALQAILGKDAADDPQLIATYSLETDELNAINEQFDVGFKPELLGLPQVEVSIFRWRQEVQLPYLHHTGYELALMLDDRKKLTKISGRYPPDRFAGEESFDRWVQEGKLHKEAVVEPSADSSLPFEGIRTVYFTPKGEEWRIAATKLLWRAAAAAGGWNEYFERLEGMLFGYEDWQNDWWIEDGMKSGRFAGVALCCPVNAAGLEWIEASGFRALPPIDKPTLPMKSFDRNDAGAMKAFILEEADSVALVRFNVLGRVLMDILDIRGNDQWPFPANRIPELNRHLRGAVAILHKRDED